MIELLMELLEFYPKFNGVKIGWELVTGKQAQLSFTNIFPGGQTSKSNQRANPNKHPNPSQLLFV